MSQEIISLKPVYDANINIVGYELLFRVSWNEPSSGAPREPTQESLENFFTSADETVFQDVEMIFIPLSKSLIKSGMTDVFEPKDVVVLFDERWLKFEESHIDYAAKLKKEGFRVCLTGNTIIDGFSEHLNHVDFIKIDAFNLEQTELRRISEFYQKTHCKLVVDNVHGYDSFNRCLELGYECFEGNFLSLPNITNATKAKTNRMITLRLITALDDPNVTVEGIEELLSHDPRLSYKLIRVVNSAAFGLYREVTSLKEVIVFIGLQQLRELASIIVLSSIEEKPSSLILLALTRAKMADVICDKLKLPEKKIGFMVGLFSTLDALLDMKFEEIFKDLRLPDRCKLAITNYDGELGKILKNVIYFQRGQWDDMDLCGLPTSVWMEAYLQGMSWSISAVRAMRELEQQAA